MREINNWKNALIAIVFWLILVVGLYIWSNPIQNGVVREDKFKEILAIVVFSGIVLIVLLQMFILNKEPGAKIISCTQALSELSVSEKAKLKIKNINNMTIGAVYPKNDGKSVLITYLIEEGPYRGNMGWVRLNCMSDYKYSATGIARDSRLEAYDAMGKSYGSASTMLNTSERGAVDKVVKLSRELKKAGTKGGQVAQDVLEDAAEQEERRMEGNE